MGLVKFNKSLTQAQFNVAEKDSETLYFISDTAAIYLGERLIAQGNSVTSVAGKTGAVTLQKADITDFPTTMTADGGNADTVDGKHASDFATAAQGELAVNAIPSSQKGQASGVATLDVNGKVPSTQLPSYVDDVLEYASLSNFPSTGETGKIYVALDTNKTYRWGGTSYVVISETLSVGTTTGTAFDGKAGYDHVTDNTIHITSVEREAWNAKYDKPSAGIDLDDLSYTVKNKLANADEVYLNLGGHTVKTDVPEDAVFTDTTYGIASLNTLGLVKAQSVNDFGSNGVIITKQGLLQANSGTIKITEAIQEAEKFDSNKFNGDSVQVVFANVYANLTDIVTALTWE